MLEQNTTRPALMQASGHARRREGWTLIKSVMTKINYFVTMPENQIHLRLGTYNVQIDSNRFDIEQVGNSPAIVTAKDKPNLKATISIEQVPRGLDRDGIFRDSINRDPTGILHKMLNVDQNEMAAISLPRSNIIINGHQGFDFIITNSGISAYRIGYWLDDDTSDVVNIFASFPEESGFKDDLQVLANSLHVVDA
jgi:hypothetical protein